jgi:solute carrier family 35 (UDP-galactose transporter), member B1
LFRVYPITSCLTVNIVWQVFIFAVIKEFGSLVSVSIAITRKLFNILLSVVLFKHRVYWWQWVGVASVFAGLGISAVYDARRKAAKGTKPKGE